MLCNLITTWIGIALLLVCTLVDKTFADDSIADLTAAPAEPILPIPLHPNLSAAKVALGSKLFADRRLSHDNGLSCASCHLLDHGGAGNTPLVEINKGPLKIVNTPTVFNARYNYRHGWLGSTRTLEEQVHAGLRQLTTDANGTSRLTILPERVNQNSEYQDEFSRLYGDGVNPDNIADALAEYVRSLVTPNARFDRYLRGDENAISDEEKRGYMLFKEYGCVSCHQGVNVGGNLYQKFGIFYNYIAARGNIKHADSGRFSITGRQQDMHVFRVPSLRNVALTGPYLHDGEARSLQQAVAIMGRTQLGKFLDHEDIELIVGFLNTLTGEYDGRIPGDTGY